MESYPETIDETSFDELYNASKTQLLKLVSNIDEEYFKELLKIVTMRYNVTLKQIVESKDQIEVSDDMYRALDMIMIDSKAWYNRTITRNCSTINNNFVNELKNYSCQFNQRKCDTIENAARNGHLDCLKQLLGSFRNLNYSSSNVITASLSNIDCLKYLHLHGFSVSHHTCYMAVGQGKLDCLKYLHKIGCTLDSSLFQCAIQYDKLECLKYLYENGCLSNFDKDYWLLFAKSYNNKLCIEYLESL